MESVIVKQSYDAHTWLLNVDRPGRIGQLCNVWKIGERYCTENGGMLLAVTNQYSVIRAAEYTYNAEAGLFLAEVLDPDLIALP